MNRLSAIDAFGPAFARVGAMLFRPFRLGVWLKMGLIGLLGGGAVMEQEWFAKIECRHKQSRDQSPSGFLVCQPSAAHS